MDKLVFIAQTVCLCLNADVPSTPLERLATPLRKLRVTLGEFGAPLSQEEFAKRTGLSLATVRGVENERRALSPASLQKVTSSLWAHWDDAAQEWRPIWDKSRVYTKADAETAASFLPEGKGVRARMIEKLEERIRTIAQAVPPNRFVGEVMMLNALLADYARASGYAVDLEPTEPRWILSEEKKPAGTGVIQRVLRPEYSDAKVPKSTPRTKK